MSGKQKVKFGRSAGFFPVFERRPGPAKLNMHYCPGCGHGILHKLIAEAIVDFDLKDKLIVIAPVGCAVFSYYYFDCAGISVPHGRAPAVATGLLRSNPESFVISYQGDGDLGAIGLNEFLQAANRGENMVVCFVNNAIYGMTSGQMAPTSLIGQKTTTSPYGRTADNEGYPLKVSEMVATLASPIYVERVALTSPKRIRAARQALRKGFTYMRERRGFSLIEFLSGCPINFKLTPAQSDRWIEEQMIPYYPLGCFKDIAAERHPIVRPVGIYDPDQVRAVLYPEVKTFSNNEFTLRKELRIKCAGAGGQGILSLGLMIAVMGRLRNINVTWLPSYGPEMRGGTANCGVVLSNQKIGSPLVRECNLLIAMNQPSLERFLPELSPEGILLYDSTNIPAPQTTCRVISVPAAAIAQDLGAIQCANSVMMGAFAAALMGRERQEYTAVFDESIAQKFHHRPDIIAINQQAFRRGFTEMRRDFTPTST
jgi:2-oxoisovalerate ferredoxin oxidoreductase beta subunit